MMIKNDELLAEWNLINGLLTEEVNKTIPTYSWIVEDFTEYMAYLDKCYRKGASASRPAFITKYINQPSEMLR